MESEKPPARQSPALGDCARFYLPAQVVEVERVSQASVLVKSKWHEPFYVDQETFVKEFVEI